MIWFRVFGILLSANALLLVLMVVANNDVRASGGRDLRPLLFVVALSVPLVFGLFHQRRWAAVLFSAPLALIGVWLVFGSGDVPFPFRLFNIAFALMLGIPAVVTAFRWKALR